MPEAVKYHDGEHEASLKKHLADYESERRERIADEEGGQLHSRQADAAGPDDRHHATPKQFAAVEAALKQELAEAEKYHDTQHIASIEKHWAEKYHDKEHIA